jgi:uncharacterized protein
MSRNHEHLTDDHTLDGTSRRQFLQSAATAVALLSAPPTLFAALTENSAPIEVAKRFPYFTSTPVPYFNITMRDTFWAPRQRALSRASVPWATRHFDESGGLDAFRSHPNDYTAKVRVGDIEAVKFVEAMAAVIGLQRDPSIEGLIDAWGREMIAAQSSDGYWPFGWPLATDPAKRWRAVWWSHEDYSLGHYLESSIELRESTGSAAMYDSALRAVDNMAATFLGSQRAYAPGHEEIEHALMRLYGLTGNVNYLQLCGWLIAQRGHHKHRPSFGKYSQDHIPVKDQRTIEGHAVRAAFLYNGVTEYVGATGDTAYREAVLAIWDDLVNHKMYLHGAGGVMSAKNEGYISDPDVIPPNDAYGESCSVFGNFQWAHSLFRLTGDASHIDVAERMLYNAFYASLSLSGDRFFYHNVAQKDEPIERFEWHPVPCCPPNIVKLFAKIGGFFYSIDNEGVFVKLYGSSEANIPLGEGVVIEQKTDYPWDGKIRIQVTPKKPIEFSLRLRVPTWAKSHAVSVNGIVLNDEPARGWVTIRRRWDERDVIELDFPMPIERVTMPPRFNDYQNLAALQRGPLVYCIEQQDASVPLDWLYLPPQLDLKAERRADLLGGITVLTGTLPQTLSDNGPKAIPVMFIPYGVWNNRGPDTMLMWMQGRKLTEDEIEMQFASVPS